MAAREKFAVVYANTPAEMEQQGIYIVNEKQLTEEQKLFCRDYFFRVISPLLIPLMVRKSMQLPFFER